MDANRVDPARNINEIDRIFHDYAQRNGMEIIRVLQAGMTGGDERSWVYLVRDTDGQFKVMKEAIDYRTISDISQGANNEDELYGHLPVAHFLPRCYGAEDVEQTRFMRQSIVWGQSLKDYVRPDNVLSPSEVCSIMGELAKHLLWLLEHGVLYLDLKPSNILLVSDGVRILDLGISRIIKDADEEVEAFIAQPRYCPPEIVHRNMASVKALVFQLGVLFHELLTGKHPFAAEEHMDQHDWTAESIHFLWPMMSNPYRHDLANELGDSRLSIVSWMLEKDPSERPSLAEVIDYLGRDQVHINRQKGRNRIRPKMKNTVLFPARMGIPHQGHIEYMVRILELGYYLKISVQRSYTLTDRDPVPKWLVAKMVAQSLFDRGFSEEDFEIVYTPFFETTREMMFHFQMMPGIADVVAVASNNPEVQRLFSHYPIINQDAVFGNEGEVFEDLSWGESLRQAVRSNKEDSFNKLAASGVKRVLPFALIQRMYAKPLIEFVPGTVEVVLTDDTGQTIVRDVVFRYLSPEESVVRLLEEQGVDCRITDRYSPDTKVLCRNCEQTIRFVGIKFDGKNETIHYKLV